MPQLNWWEQFIIGTGISMLLLLESKITNSTEKAALQATIAFLQSLMNGQAKKLAPFQVT